MSKRKNTIIIICFILVILLGAWRSCISVDRID